MSWFGKKEKKGVKVISNSELPPFPDEFDQDKGLPEIKNELPPLPSFPQSKTSSKLSEEIVKQAIKVSKSPEIEEPEESIEASHSPLTQEIDEDIPTPKFQPQETIRTSQKIEPVYVRIDKYQESLQAFSDIKKKIIEIESVLKEVKELKQKEDSELQEWTDEIQKAKLKLGEIDSALFQKLG